MNRHELIDQLAKMFKRDREAVEMKRREADIEESQINNDAMKLQSIIGDPIECVYREDKRLLLED